MPLVLNQSHGAHDRSFPNSLLHSPSSTSPATSSPRHRRTRSLQNQKLNRHHHSQSLPRIIDQLPPHHLNPNLAYAASLPHYQILPALSSLHVAPPIAIEPIQVPSPISPEEMEHQRPRHPDDPIDDHEWAYVFTEIIRQARDRNRMPRYSSQILYDAIVSSGFEPSWDEISLPGGRSMRSYQEGFLLFPQHGPGMRTSGQTGQPKRPLPVDPQTVTGRPLAPKPLNPGITGSTRLGGGIPATLSPLGGGPVGIDQPRRKRGRPSKKEQEERRLRQGGADPRISELGPLQPALYSPSTQGRHFPGQGDIPASPSTSQHPQYGTARTTPQATSRAGSSTNSGSSGKKRGRGRPSKNPASSGPPPPFSLEASTSGPAASQQAGRREEGRESETSTKSRQGAPLAPPETTLGGTSTSASGSGQQQTTEAEESKSQTRWKDTILNE